MKKKMVCPESSQELFKQIDPSDWSFAYLLWSLTISLLQNLHSDSSLCCLMILSSSEELKSVVPKNQQVSCQLWSFGSTSWDSVITPQITMRSFVFLALAFLLSVRTKFWWFQSRWSWKSRSNLLWPDWVQGKIYGSWLQRMIAKSFSTFSWRGFVIRFSQQDQSNSPPLFLGRADLESGRVYA